MHMRGLVRMTSLWPGFARLWRRGDIQGLLIALSFAVVLNLALVVTFAPERILPDWGVAGELWPTVLAWVFVLSFWIVGVRAGQRVASRLKEPSKTIDPELEARFVAAQQQYLRGHWIEAETLLKQLLAVNPEDCEARLLLASVERRSGLSGDARRTLVSLQEMPAAGRWHLEIERELAILNAASSEELLPDINAPSHITHYPPRLSPETVESDLPTDDSPGLRRAA
jgi:hypothetical protein